MKSGRQKLSKDPRAKNNTYWATTKELHVMWHTFTSVECAWEVPRRRQSEQRALCSSERAWGLASRREVLQKPLPTTQEGRRLWWRSSHSAILLGAWESTNGKDRSDVIEKLSGGSSLWWPQCPHTSPHSSIPSNPGEQKEQLLFFFFLFFLYHTPLHLFQKQQLGHVDEDECAVPHLSPNSQIYPFRVNKAWWSRWDCSRKHLDEFLTPCTYRYADATALSLTGCTGHQTHGGSVKKPGTSGDPLGSNR